MICLAFAWKAKSCKRSTVALNRVPSIGPMPYASLVGVRFSLEGSNGSGPISWVQAQCDRTKIGKNRPNCEL